MAKNGFTPGDGNSMKRPYLGRHILVDLYGCDDKILRSRELIRSLLVEAAQLAKATIVTEVFHEFNPHGISGVVVIAESHIAIHTWPEHACAAVDIFSCGTKMQPDLIEVFLKEAFQAKESVSRELGRGIATGAAEPRPQIGLEF